MYLLFFFFLFFFFFNDTATTEIYTLSLHDALPIPGPWYAVGDGQVWRLPLADVPPLDPEQPGPGPALYPGLVTIGADAAGQVLVDLEAARGVIAVTGPDELVAEALAAMATELATSAAPTRCTSRWWATARTSRC